MTEKKENVSDLYGLQPQPKYNTTTTTTATSHRHRHHRHAVVSHDIEVNIKSIIGESESFEFQRVLLKLHFRQSRHANFKKMKKLHTPNHKFYEQYYINQAKQKGGNLSAFHGAQLRQGYGLGNIFRGLFCWAVPHLQQGAKVLSKKALQTGANVAQDVIAGENLNTAVSKRAKQAIGDLLPQEGAGRKAIKRKTQFHNSARNKKRKTTPRREGRENFELWF